MIEMTVVALLVINIFLVLFTFSTYRDLQNVKLLNEQTHAAMGSLVGRVMLLEQGLSKIMMGITELLQFAETIASKVEFDIESEYRSIDGMHTARSMEELMDKMRRDPNSSMDDSLDNLKKLFEENDDED